MQKSPYQKLIVRFIGNSGIRGFLQELFECDLCLGVWVYTLLAWIMQINMYHFYVPVVSEILTGASASFLVWLVATGFRERFFTIHIS